MSRRLSAVTDGFTFRLDNKNVLARLKAISEHYADLSPAMLAIGEYLTESTKERFSAGIGPDGAAWKPNAPATIADIHRRIINSGKSKKRFAKAAAATANKKPLIDSGLLQDTIRYQLINGGNGVEVGTDRFSGEWDGGAAVHQFGSRDGKIRARPFLGMSADDESEVLDILDSFARQPI